jgi:hypothetical protein
VSVSPLAAFARSHGLDYSETAVLPQQGATLTRSSGKVEGAASGALPGGIEGTLCRFTYVYEWSDSDNNTRREDRPFTLVVTEIPESIGFVPYLGFSGPASKLDEDAGGEDMAPIEMEHVKALKGFAASAYRGVSERWLAQLLSPAMVQWLGRCDEDFGFELASGVLVVGRNGYLGEPRQLEALCADATHLAGTIREESLEEVGTGGESEAARDVDFANPATEATLAQVRVGSPADLAAAKAEFAAHLRGSGATLFGALRSGLLWTLVFNVPAIAIPIVLISSGLYLPLAIFELAIFLLIAVVSFRSRVRNGAQKLAAEAFYRAYAAERELELLEPLGFLATHAEAKLGFKPDRVFGGVLPGGMNGALALSGDGRKRSDRVAAIAGPRGPVAEAELQAEEPGLSATTLDDYAKRLSAEIAEDIATRPG